MCIRDRPLAGVLFQNNPSRDLLLDYWALLKRFRYQPFLQVGHYHHNLRKNIVIIMIIYDQHIDDIRFFSTIVKKIRASHVINPGRQKQASTPYSIVRTYTIARNSIKILSDWNYILRISVSSQQMSTARHVTLTAKDKPPSRNGLRQPHCLGDSQIHQIHQIHRAGIKLVTIKISHCYNVTSNVL